MIPVCILLTYWINSQNSTVMQYSYNFWTILVGLIFSTPVFGQATADTLSLTGTMADTVVANNYSKEAFTCFKRKEWDKALGLLDIAGTIFLSTTGAESAGYGLVLHRKGLIYRNINQLDSAIRYYEMAISVRSKALNFYHEDVANSYNNAGNAYRAKGDADMSLDRHKKALEIRQHLYGENNADVAASYYSIALAYFDKSDYEKSLESHRKALTIRLVLQDAVDLANSYNDIGITLSEMGQFEGAVDNLRKALVFRIESYGSDSPEVASVYNNIGGISCYAGDYQTGLSAFQHALETRIKLLGNNSPKVAETYENIGLALAKIGRYREALINYLKSKAIIVNNLGPDDPKVAKIDEFIAGVYMRFDEHQKSIEYHFDALRIYAKSMGENNLKVAGVYNNLGVSYAALGDYIKSEAYHLKDLEITRLLLGENHLDVSTVYLNLGILFRKKQDYEQSIQYNEQALQMRLNLVGPNSIEVAESYSNMANVYDDIGRYDKAVELHEKALLIFKYNLHEAHPFFAQVYNNLANPYLSKGKLEKTIEMCHNALLVSGYNQLNDMGRVLNLEQTNKALFLLAKTSIRQYQNTAKSIYLSQSMDWIRQAMTGLDYQLHSASNDIDKTHWIALDKDLYELPFQAYFSFRKSIIPDALNQLIFTASEKIKSNLLYSQFKELGASHFASIPDSMLQQEQSLRIDLTWREKQRQSLLDQNLSETDTTVLTISSKIFDLRRQYETLKDTLETRYPEYYRLKYDLSTVSLDYVQDTLLQKGQTLLEYFTGDSAVYLFVIRPDTFQVVEVKKDFPLEDWVKHLRHGLTDAFKQNTPSPTYQESTAREYVSSAYDLYQKLIAPVENLLTDTIIVVPDGVLGYVPFDVLLSEKPVNPTRFHSHSYLGKERHISYSYSATLLKEMREKKHRVQPTESLLALAPFFRGSADQLREQVDTMSELLALRRDTLSALPATGREALIVSKIFGGKALLGAESPKEILQQEAGRYRILHLSTHGKADDKVGDYAYLGFALPGNLLAFDKFYAKDIYNLSLNADLVTLSACETGIGELKRGEGIISLARAFAYAGAKSIVTTLWSVNDVRTSELMENFYKGLYNGMDKDAALWQAKKDFLKNHKGMAAHPYYWAGFIPIGDMSAIRN